MKKVSVYLISILILFQTSLLAYNSDPKDFVAELVNEAIVSCLTKISLKKKKLNLLNKLL
jgi:hypothetical protein